jgi:hypothetical protein
MLLQAALQQRSRMLQPSTIKPHDDVAADISLTSGAAAAAACCVLLLLLQGQRLWVGLESCCVGFSIDSLKRRTFGAADIL